MANVAEHVTNIREALVRAEYDDEEIGRLAPFLGGVLKVLEASHDWARYEIGLIEGEAPPEPEDMEDAESELAFGLYWIHNPTHEVQSFIDSDAQLSRLWPVLVEAAPAPAYTPDEFLVFCATLDASDEVWVTSDGNIIGMKQYEMLDPGWLWCPVNYIYTWLGHHEVKDTGTPSTSPIPLQANGDGKVRIAIIGDWGTGTYHSAGCQPAVDVMDTIRGLKEPVDYIIHLGDTYYCGTDAGRIPKGEEQDNLVAPWKQYGPKLPSGRLFTLNSNHEMYGGAKGLFDTAYADPMFGAQVNCSYFALTFGDWVIAGLDSAYYDSSFFYMKGGLGDSEGEHTDPQYDFLEKVKGWGEKRILLSHHTGIDTKGTKPMPLWDEITGSSFPDYWYWGHTHLGIVYGKDSHAGQQGVKARCVGHSAVPFGAPWGLEGISSSIVEWYSQTPLDEDPDLAALPKKRHRAKNGFAVLTLGQSDIHEAIYDAGNTSPIWQSQ